MNYTFKELTAGPRWRVVSIRNRGALTMPTYIDALQTFAACFAIAGAIIAALS